MQRVHLSLSKGRLAKTTPISYLHPLNYGRRDSSLFRAQRVNDSAPAIDDLPFPCWAIALEDIREAGSMSLEAFTEVVSVRTPILIQTTSEAPGNQSRSRVPETDEEAGPMGSWRDDFANGRIGGFGNRVPSNE
jgi:hypothetical protein